MDATPQAPEGTTEQELYSDLLSSNNNWQNFNWDQPTFSQAANPSYDAQEGVNANQLPPRSEPSQQWSAPYGSQSNFGDFAPGQDLSTFAEFLSTALVPEGGNVASASQLQYDATSSFVPDALSSTTADFGMNNDGSFLLTANSDLSYQLTSANDVSYTATNAETQALDAALVQFAGGVPATQGFDQLPFTWTTPGRYATANPSTGVTGFQNGQVFDPLIPVSNFDSHITPAMDDTTQFNMDHAQTPPQKDTTADSFHLRNDSGIIVPNMSQEIVPALRTHAKESRVATSSKRGRAKKKEPEPLTFAIVYADPATNTMKGKITKPRRAFDPQRRKEVGAVRKIGACFRCKMWNVSVNILPAPSAHPV